MTDGLGLQRPSTHKFGAEAETSGPLCRRFQRLLSNSTPDSDLHAAGTAIDHFVVVRFLTACFCDKVVVAALRALQLYGKLIESSMSIGLFLSLISSDRA
jgi:hypothetical protein